MSGTSCSYLLSACQRKWLIPRTSTLKTAGDGPKADTSDCEVHAEGHFRRRLSTLKMLLSGHLHKEKSILADRKTPPARFFLFGKGKILWEIGRFCSDRQSQHEPRRDSRPPAVQPSAARQRRATSYELRKKNLLKRLNSLIPLPPYTASLLRR